jgi:hypothetical protein
MVKSGKIASREIGENVMERTHLFTAQSQSRIKFPSARHYTCWHYAYYWWPPVFQAAQWWHLHQTETESSRALRKMAER